MDAILDFLVQTFPGLYENDKGYTPFQITMYFTGGICWAISYAMVTYRIIKHKFLEYPIMAVTANVVWEVIWGFFLPLDFGGLYLQVLWRLALFMDIFLFYTVLTKGKIQVSLPYLQKHYVPIMVFSAAAWAGIVYSFYQSGADLPMGFNSGMILNVMMSALSLTMFWGLPNQRFSFWAGFFRTIATDVFLMIYIIDRSPTLLFPIVTGILSALLDSFYLYLVYCRNKQLKSST